jgi:alanine racemase
MLSHVYDTISNTTSTDKPQPDTSTVPILITLITGFGRAGLKPRSQTLELMLLSVGSSMEFIVKYAHVSRLRNLPSSQVHYMV